MGQKHTEGLKGKGRSIKDRIMQMINLGIRQFRDPYYQGIAAQVAFFFMLSLMPTMIIISQVLGALGINLSSLNINLGELISINIAPEVMTHLQHYTKFESQTSTNIVLIIAAIWAASRLQFTLMRVANYTFSDGKDAGTFLKDRVRSIGTMLLTILAMVLVVMVLVYGQILLKFLTDMLLISRAYDVVLTYLKWPLTGGLYLLVVSFNYYVLPHDRTKYKDIMPGSIFCAVGMLIVSMIYSFYTGRAFSNNIIYGSMASVAALMFWFYFISWVMILGIFFNKVWVDTREGK